MEGVFLPALGSVVSFGVGTVVGSEICHVLGMEGCWYFHSDGADPAIGGKGEWQFLTVKLEGKEGFPDAPAYNWYWNPEGYFTYDFIFNGLGGVPEKSGCGITPPGSMTGFYPLQHTYCESPSDKRGAAQRSAMANRSLEYHPTDDPEIGNYEWEAPEDWSEKVAGRLAEPAAHGMNIGASERVGEYIASQIEGSEVPNPYGSIVVVPDCDGLLYATCAELLEEQGLSPERDDRNWETADLDLEPDEVIEMEPAPATEVETGTKVTVVTNPDESGMPLVVPPITPGENYADYVKKLGGGWLPENHVLSPEFTDPHFGPNDVTRTSPQPGTRADPASETEIDIYTNDADAPPAAGTWSAPSIPGLDLSPFGEVEIGCNDFPFGVFCWIGDGLTSWGSSGSCPSFNLPLGSTVGADGLPVDFCDFEPAMEIVRPIIVLVSAFCLAYLFAAAAMGFGGSTGSED